MLEAQNETVSLLFRDQTLEFLKGEERPRYDNCT